MKKEKFIPIATLSFNDDGIDEFNIKIDGKDLLKIPLPKGTSDKFKDMEIKELYLCIKSRD